MNKQSQLDFCAERRGRPYDEVFENLPNTREARDSGEAAASSSMPHPVRLFSCQRISLFFPNK